MLKLTHKNSEVHIRMNKFFKSRMLKSMIPYLIFAFVLIILFRLTAEIRFFTDTIGRFWGIITPFLTGAIIAYIFNLPCSAIQRLILKLDNPFIMRKIGSLKRHNKNEDNVFMFAFRKLVSAGGAVLNFIIRKSRAFSIVLLIVLTALVIALILHILIPAIVSSTTLFIAEIPNYEATIRGWLNRVGEMDLPDYVTEHINEDAIIAAVLGWVENVNFGDIFAGIISGFGGIAAALFHAFLSIVSALYLLVEKDKFKAFVMKFIAAVSSVNVNETILKYSRNLDFNFRKYIVAQTIDGLILGSLMTILLLIFRSPFALVLGLILGIVNYIPYFGSIFGTALAVLVIAFTQDIQTAAIAAIFMFALQQFDGNFIQPKLMGRTFSLSPLLVIISVTIGMHYGGILGMLVAIPIVAILKDLTDTFIEHKKNAKTKPIAEDFDDDFMDRDIW